ncbi:hypothetical protein [Bacillus sp. FJAT-28004]|uniref:hypothetical protein n=1 Tax=Bacillus sp. FJAT-28004 TaxID=1679165 RepID=UPI0006B5719C|nr:hypothetical protein [Bacillus sp. FJAT-28004]
MNDFNKFNREKWSKLRTKGKLPYAIRWVLYLLFYILFIQGLLIVLDRKSVDEIEIGPIIFISVIVGVAVSMIRWSVFEKKYKQE